MRREDLLDAAARIRHLALDHTRELAVFGHQPLDAIAELPRAWIEVVGERAAYDGIDQFAMFLQPLAEQREQALRLAAHRRRVHRTARGTQREHADLERSQRELRTRAAFFMFDECV